MRWWRGATKVRSGPESNNIGTPAPTMFASSRLVHRTRQTRPPSAYSTSWPPRGHLDGSLRSADIVLAGRRKGAADGRDDLEREGIGDVLGNHPIDQSHGETNLSRGAFLAGGRPLRLGLPRPHRKPGERNRPAAPTSLEDHRQPWTHRRGGAGSGCRWRAAGARSGR